MDIDQDCSLDLKLDNIGPIEMQWNNWKNRWKLYIFPLDSELDPW